MASGKRTLTVAALAALLGLLLALPCLAGDQPAIRFAPGASSASMKGEIQGGDRDVYPVTAKAGQTMKVTLANKSKALVFRVLLPGGGDEDCVKGAGPEDDATAWEGKLPKDGTYQIMVGGRGKDTRYTLTVEIR